MERKRRGATQKQDSKLRVEVDCCGSGSKRQCHRTDATSPCFSLLVSCFLTHSLSIFAGSFLFLRIYPSKQRQVIILLLFSRSSSPNTTQVQREPRQRVITLGVIVVVV